SEPLLPGFPLTETVDGSYDISPDGRQVVMQAMDSQGKRRLWVASLDRRSPPRQIPGVEGDGPVFGRNGEIFFRAREGEYGFAYSVHPDGSGPRKLSDHPVIGTKALSPDGQWLLVYARLNKEQHGGTLALPVNGGPPLRVFGRGPSRAQWSVDGKLLFITIYGSEKTYVM